jgi:glycosyltransferase involved in cell wall biosynthesis
MSAHEPRTAGNRSVAIIVTSAGAAIFLRDALRSCMRQRIKPSEILMVIDRSQNDAERLAASFPRVRVHLVDDLSRSAARNIGLARITSNFVVFLDAGERLTERAIEAGLECFNRNENAWLVCGAHRVIDMVGRPASAVWRERLIAPQSLDLPHRIDAIAVQAAVMYRSDHLRRTLTASGLSCSFTNDFERCIATHDCCVAEYLYDRRLTLSRHLIGTDETESPLREATNTRQFGQQLIFHHNAPRVFADAAIQLIRNGPDLDLITLMLRAAKMAPLSLLKTCISRSVDVIKRRVPRSIGQHFGEALWVPGVGSVQFGDFGRTKPISIFDGFDRGTPIDRYYIERALAERSTLIRGRVLEAHGREYTKSFGGGNVAHSDVLDIDARNPAATIVGDLGVVGSLPEGAFDCIVLTQTLQFIYDPHKALDNLYRALSPDGTLLISVPGISAIGHNQTHLWYWEFTELSLKTLLVDHFGKSNVDTRSYGNVFAAICFLTGLSIAEVGTERLEYTDDRYPVTVFACARKTH